MDHRDVPEPTPLPVEPPPAAEAHASDDVPAVASNADLGPIDAAVAEPVAAEVEPSLAPDAEAAPPETPRPAAAQVDTGTDTDAHRSAFGEPIATEATPNEPAPSTPAVSEPVAIEPVASEATPNEPAPSEPVASEPVGSESVASESVTSESVASEPAASEPIASETVPSEAAPVAVDGQPEQPAPPAPVDPRRLRAQQAWERVVAAHTSGEQVTGTVTAAVKGGLLVDVGGIRGFLPASQVRVPIGTAIEALVKTKVPLKVLDVDTGRRRIVVSQRRAVDEERRTKRSELLRSLEVGQIREAVVARLADFGAFVDLGGIDGLIPMRELAFERVEKTSDVVNVGERVMVQVLRIEEGGKKIALSRKNALPDPWRDHAALLRNGSTHEGRVVAKEPQLIVELAPGVTGSVRTDEANPDDYELGEAIEVTVRSVDRVRRRINLTTMQAAAAAAAASASAASAPQTTMTASGFAPLGVELAQRKK